MNIKQIMIFLVISVLVLTSVAGVSAAQTSNADKCKQYERVLETVKKMTDRYCSAGKYYNARACNLYKSLAERYQKLIDENCRPTLSCEEADLNGNGAVNSQDLLWFSSNVIQKYDFNKDKVCDMADMLVIRQHVGEKGASNMYDVNGNGVVNSQDMLWYQQTLIPKYDYSGDGKINAEDLLILRNKIDECKPKCTDSDGGLNYYVKGTCIDNAHGYTRTHTDVCGAYVDGVYNPNLLTEFYCREGGDCYSEEYDCPYGCEDGACLKDDCSSHQLSIGEVLNKDGKIAVEYKTVGAAGNVKAELIIVTSSIPPSGGESGGGSANGTVEEPTVESTEPSPGGSGGGGAGGISCPIISEACSGGSGSNVAYCTAYTECNYPEFKPGTKYFIKLTDKKCPCVYAKMEIKPTQACTDSDGGVNYYIKGTVSYADEGTNTDVCINRNPDGSWGDIAFEAPYLVEYSCLSSTNSIKDIYECPNGCKDGACLKEDLCGTLLYFYMNGCPHCAMEEPIIKQISENFGCIKTEWVDISAQQDYAKKYGVTSVPTMIFLKGDCTKEKVGYSDYDSLKDWLYNGLCKEEKKCTDSDGGIDYYTKGIVDYGEGSQTWDQCNNELPNGGIAGYTQSTLLERNCVNGEVDTIFHECPNGCQSGVCLKDALFPNPNTCSISDGVKAYDVNSDGKVDKADRDLVESYWRSSTYNEKADVNKDTVVNAADRGILNAFWRTRDNNHDGVVDLSDDI